MDEPSGQQPYSSCDRTPGEPPDEQACRGCHSKRDRDAGLAAGVAFLMLVVVYVVAAIWGAGD